jgi:DNA-binding transcriptional LysR family regulator
MELRRLRYFIAAVEEGSLLGASRRVNVAQPALSRQIRDLEESLGFALLERDTRGVRLTHDGAGFYRDALEVVGAFDKAMQKARRAKLERHERVRLGVVRTASKYAFANRALDAFKGARPSATVELTCTSSRALIGSMRRGHLDLALLFQQQPDLATFNERIIHAERYILAIHPRHPLAAGRTPIRMRDLSGEPLVWMSRVNNLDNHDLLLQQCRVHGLEPVIGYEANSQDEQLELLSISGGICLTPASTRLSTPPDKLVFRVIADFHMELQLRLAWRKDLGKSPAAELLAELMAAIDAHQAEIAAGTEAWSKMPDGQIVVRCPTPATA